MKILFDGFDQLAEEIDKAGANLKDAVDEALSETQKLIQRKVTDAAKPYASRSDAHPYASGDMYRAIIDKPEVEWTGMVAEVAVGFDLTAKGGFHSIYVMNGTKVHGTPRVKKDQKLWNAIKGAQTKKEIAAVQEEVLRKYLKIGGE